ncbi:recombinase family protein [Vitreoscilla stercoraria]|uniref:recombinase family protein n=1 Tax=Vitreoscilla stercoraria TaxID=61 RepID=UPI000374F44B|nr:recombinase family protein [Vitreoscilla stercoraria]
MTIRIYVRASTKEQDAERALSGLIQFSQNYGSEYVAYIENESGTKLNRPILNQLLNESMPGDILMIESVDRLSCLQELLSNLVYGIQAAFSVDCSSSCLPSLKMTLLTTKVNKLNP